MQPVMSTLCKLTSKYTLIIRRKYTNNHSKTRMASKRDTSLLSASDGSMLTAAGFTALGLNPTSKSATVPWVGSDGIWTNEFINQSGNDVIVVCWGAMGSWVNAVQPQITISIPAGGSKTVSFPDGWSGAWAPFHPGQSQLVNGQISDTWGEATFAAPYSVVDVSREVNHGGKSMQIVGPQCTSDMNTCVFQCQGGLNTCTTGYELVNCATGSQPGANFGTYNGAASGGCGGMGNGANLKTYLGN